jgi:uncharacterized damage-inducible protein DinB
MSEYFLRLVRAMAWADRASLDAVRAAGSSEGLRLLGHVLGAQEAWLSRIVGREARIPVWPSLTLHQASEWANLLADEWTELLGRQPNDSWGRVVSYRNQAGTEYQSTLADIVTHVAQHGAYHRGQVARALGPASVNTDFITFTRQG